MLSSLFALVLLGQPGLDLNRASLEQLRALDGITDAQADSLHEYILETGGLSDIYQVMSVPGFTAAELEWLRARCSVFPPSPGRITPAVLDVMERLAVEDGPGDAAIDEWENDLVRPLPVNTLRLWDIRMLQGVSLVDAAAVERRLRTLGPVSSVTSLRGSEDLSYYGWRSMRDYVSTRSLDLTDMGVFGAVRIAVDGGAGRDEADGTLEGRMDDLHSAMHDMETGGRDYSGSPVDSSSLYSRLQSESEELSAARNTAGTTERIRAGVGDRLRFGARLSRGRNSTAGFGLVDDLDLGGVSDTYDVAKVFASMQYLGPVQQVILGNYRLALAQGLMIDNTDELISRTLYRPWGLHPDLTPTRQFALTGAAAEIRTGPVIGYGFLSSAARDAIINPDGSPNSLFYSDFRTSSTAGALQETTAGGFAWVDLGGILPVGTAVGAGAMSVAWDDSLAPDPATLDIPNDSEIWNMPEYDDMPSGTGMSVCSIAGQAVLGRFALESETAVQDGDATAMLTSARWQNNWFYLLGAWRHYGMGFTNPYNRGFSEQARFADTEFEKPYYLNDPLYGEMENWPAPKPEEGLYLESRFQISRQLIVPRVYVDLWRSLPWGFDNYRFQGEIEYRPVFPVRFRLKYKLQDKTRMQDVLPTSSVTQEWTLRTFVLPAGEDMFEVDLRSGLVELTPNPLYNDDRLMSGGYVSARWEHRIDEDLSLMGGTTLWTTSGMSQWEFDDTGIDFLDGRGTKLFLTLKQTVSDALQLRFRLLRKETFFPRNGLYRPDPVDQYYYEGDPDSPVADFGDAATSYRITCQLDFRW